VVERRERKPAAAHTTTIGAAAHTITIGAAAHTITIGAAAHTITIGAAAHTITDSEPASRGNRGTGVDLRDLGVGPGDQ
jgi:hypothetical protein